MPKGDFTARALHANNLDLATGPKAPKISQSLSKLEVSQCPSSMQKSIDTPWGHKRAFPVFLLLLSPPLSLFHFSTTSLSGTLQCALLSSRAIYSQVISSVSPPPTWPLSVSSPYLASQSQATRPLLSSHSASPHASHTCSSSPSPEDPISPPAQNPLTLYKSCILPNCQSPKR